jgi:outer membrane biosynthesis protein TonB
MPIRVVPADVNPATPTPGGGSEPEFDSGRDTAVAVEIPIAGEDRSSGGTPVVRASRWIDYETHELLELIGQLEDERRWARLREGILWAVLIHILAIIALFVIPKYVLKMRPVVETPNNKEFTYLDSPFVPRAKPVKPLTHEPLIDKNTLDELKRQSQAPPTPATPPPPPQEQAPVEQKPQATQPISPNPQSQAPVEAPRPAAVPARPDFNQLSHNNENLADQLQRDMRDSARSHGGESGQIPSGGGLPMHPGAGTGGVQILTPTQGVNFNAWLAAWYYETKRTWDPLIPEEVNPPIAKQGQVLIRFKVLPNGRLMDGSLVLEGRSGDTALDRAAWGALTGSSYPPLPKDFHGPYIELRAWFLYNMEPPQQ